MSSDDVADNDANSVANNAADTGERADDGAAAVVGDTAGSARSTASAATAAATPAPTPAGEPILSVRDLAVFYGAAQALNGISFDVYPGEVVTIIGANGAGKTTTLKTISGVAELLKSSSGSVTFKGERVEKKAAHKIAAMGMAHSPEGRRVFPQSTVEENLLLGAYTRRRESGIADTLEDVYRRFPRLAERRTQQAGLMSGGEQQMLAIGRALMARPDFLLLDEPSLGLAPIIVSEVFGIIKALAEEGKTILLVEQMANMALKVADRAYVIETGDITLSGDAATIANDPGVREAYLGG